MGESHKTSKSETRYLSVCLGVCGTCVSCAEAPGSNNKEENDFPSNDFFNIFSHACVNDVDTDLTAAGVCLT